MVMLIDRQVVEQIHITSGQMPEVLLILSITRNTLQVGKIVSKC